MISWVWVSDAASDDIATHECVSVRCSSALVAGLVCSSAQINGVSREKHIVFGSLVEKVEPQRFVHVAGGLSLPAVAHNAAHVAW